MTIDDGGTWSQLTFDGGDAACDERYTYAAGEIELIHPGVDSVWDAATGEATYALLYTVHGDDLADNSRCSIARVSFTASPWSADPIEATWSWYELPVYANGDAAGCAVDYSNLDGAVPSLTGEDAMLFGTYTRGGNGLGDVRWVRGGVCNFALDDPDLSTTLTAVITPYTRAYSVGAVASHPAVADLWAVLPVQDAGSMAYCETVGAGIPSPWPAFELGCTFPWPLLVQGDATTGFAISPTRGEEPLPFAPGYYPVSYPTGRPSSAVWSEIGIPDDSADGVGSYLVVGTRGQGAWRGEFTW